LLRRLILLVDVLLQLDVLDAPFASAADLDAEQIARREQGANLTDRDVEDISHIADRQEPRSVRHGSQDVTFSGRGR